MVNYHEQLARKFAARLERKEGESVSELAEPFTIKLAAVMKPLDALVSADLIPRSRCGRTVTVGLRLQPMREAMQWLRRYQNFWAARLDRLTAYAEREEARAKSRGR